MSNLRSFLFGLCCALLAVALSCNTVQKVEVSSLREFKTSPFPNLGYSVQLQEIEDCYSPEQTEFFIIMFYELWSYRFGDPEEKLLKTIKHFTVLWVPEPFPVEGITFLQNGERGDGQNLQGLTLSQNFIKVVGSSEYPTAYASLFHELVHVALWVQYNSPDYDHLGDKFPGWTDAHEELIDDLIILVLISKMGEINSE